MFRICIGPRELQSAVNRFSAAIREKDAVEARPLRELFRERPLKRIVKQIRSMNRAPRFASNRAHKPRMSMSERIHGNTGEKIEILAPIRVVHAATAASREYDRWALIRVHQMTSFIGACPRC